MRRKPDDMTDDPPSPFELASTELRALGCVQKLSRPCENPA
jgi:hypothetical protein